MKIRSWNKLFVCFPSQIESWEHFLFLSILSCQTSFLILKNRKLFLKIGDKWEKKTVTILFFFFFWGKRKTVKNEREKRGWHLIGEMKWAKTKRKWRDYFSSIFIFLSSQIKRKIWEKIVTSWRDHSWISQWVIFFVIKFLFGFCKEIIKLPPLIRGKLELQRKILVQRQIWFLEWTTKLFTVPFATQFIIEGSTNKSTKFKEEHKKIKK